MSNAWANIAPLACHTAMTTSKAGFVWRWTATGNGQLVVSTCDLTAGVSPGACMLQQVVVDRNRRVTTPSLAQSACPPCLPKLGAPHHIITPQDTVLAVYSSDNAAAGGPYTCIT